ncbi:MAG: DUF3105 domain-containing protein [Thermomicrobiales bacterium]
MGSSSARRRLVTFTATVKIALAATLLLSALAACSPAVAQDTPTPAASTDVFDPAVVEATPIPGVETFDVASADHTTDDVDYPQNPPAGGRHDPSWQKCAVYDAPVRDENAVHAQEHGAVWITYQPDLAEGDRETLAAYADNQPYVLISPYPGLEDPVVASAWGAQLRLDDVADPRLQAFIDRYAGNGPERGATCDTGVEATVG